MHYLTQGTSPRTDPETRLPEQDAGIASARQGHGDRLGDKFELCRPAVLCGISVSFPVTVV